MVKKYLKGGALNPAWCDEQDAIIMKGSILDGLYNFFNNNVDIELNLELAEGVHINISNRNKEERKEMCTIINTNNDYESKFNFIKSHSSTPEDLELAKEIIGLK